MSSKNSKELIDYEDLPPLLVDSSSCGSDESEGERLQTSRGHQNYSAPYLQNHFDSKQQHRATKNGQDFLNYELPGLVNVKNSDGDVSNANALKKATNVNAKRKKKKKKKKKTAFETVNVSNFTSNETNRAKEEKEAAEREVMVAQAEKDEQARRDKIAENANRLKSWFREVRANYGAWIKVKYTIGRLMSSQFGEQRRKQLTWAVMREELKITHSKGDMEDDSKALDFEENDVVSKMESEGLGSTSQDTAVDGAFEEDEMGKESVVEIPGPTDALEKMETLTLGPSTVVNQVTESEKDGLDEEGDNLEGLIDLEPEAMVQSILLSMHVRTWIKKFSNNRALMNLFKIRMRDLAGGKRNYCNFKELKSHRSNNRIYESKLTRGDRILFTRWANVDEDTMEVRDCLLIWYVSSHDKVPTNMEKIYNSYDRTVVKNDNWALLQPNTSSAASCFGGERVDLLLVDPDCNNMMRTFHVPATYDDIEKIGEVNWIPPLQLTEKEIEIVNTRSSVLLLGRGGTGKTYCLCYRIHRDQTRLRNIKAIFVSYTERLKNNVAFIYKNMCESCGESEASKLNVLFKTTIRSLTDYIYRELKSKGFASFPPSSPSSAVASSVSATDFTNTRNRVVYARFRDEFFCTLDKAHQKLPALRVWTQIYSFIKGSIEAAKAGAPLSREQYVNETTMSKNRCRLNKEDRGLAYTVFEKYQLWTSREALWDQMDLVIEVFGMLSRYNTVENLPFYDRVYVDEVQDLTQSEIGILFMMSSRESHAYFFAGDTAQSINDGVDFRFDEVRSCFYSVMNYNIFEHPKRLNTNFRSHDGIIQASNSVLALLYKTFPKSVDEMDTQTGLARGPKPGIVAKASLNTILRLIDADPKLRLLTWDENVEGLRMALHTARQITQGESDADLTPLSVFGIKNIKGLEFENVALVDFFCFHKVADLQKNWKFLVQHTGREPEGFPLPDLEMHLKILYTAITRARSKLLFVEREESASFSAWSRNLISNQLAERVPDQDDSDFRPSSTTTKTKKTIMLPDDYRIEGILLAEYASEPDKEIAEAASLLMDSLRNFAFVINAETSTEFDCNLIFKAKSQLKVLKLEALLARKWSERRAGDAGSNKGVDGVPADLLVSDGSTKNNHMQSICAELNDFLVKQAKLSIEVVAAEAVSVCLAAGMLEKAAELARSYCDRPQLGTLHDRIRELVDFGVE